MQSQVVLYGDAVIGDPMATPSTKNRTFATATLSETIAVSVTDEPETVEPFAGVMKANGVSSLVIVDSTKTVTRIVELPGTFLILPTTAVASIIATTFGGRATTSIRS